jgi:hypothetical protein
MRAWTSPPICVAFAREVPAGALSYVAGGERCYVN